jgi:hypothetical protein
MHDRVVNISHDESQEKVKKGYRRRFPRLLVSEKVKKCENYSIEYWPAAAARDSNEAVRVEDEELVFQALDRGSVGHRAILGAEAALAKR